MPVAPVAGVPPASTLKGFAGVGGTRSVSGYIEPSQAESDFYSHNGQVILASVVAVMFMILLFVIRSSDIFGAGL